MAKTSGGGGRKASAGAGGGAAAQPAQPARSPAANPTPAQAVGKVQASITMRDVKKKITADTYSVKDGVFTVRKGFFFTHGKTTEDFVDRVKQAFPKSTIVDSGEVFKPFKGGASVKNQSHWFVKFRA